MPTKALVAAQPGLAAWWERAKASPLGAQAVAEQAAGLKAMMANRAG
jgi:glutathione S-transferase